MIKEKSKEALITMRQKVYNVLVNRHLGISFRYHKIHDGAGTLEKYVSWIYLLWLNFAYYFLFCHFLGERPDVAAYEEKLLPVKRSESQENIEITSALREDNFQRKIYQYDIISFDIFDTLIFRPVSDPTDLFFFLGSELGILDFKHIRTEQERKARKEQYKKNGSYEVTLSDIWKQIEQEIGIDAVSGMKLEQELEMQLCYANPYMKEKFENVLRSGKKIIVTSDMYLSKEFLEKMLVKNGYCGISEIFISCEYGCNKGSGALFDLIKEKYHSSSILHIGDNEQSDIRMADKRGITSFYYPNINRMALSYRAYDMSPIIGGAYRGIVDNHIYCGIYRDSMEYEYGFIYGGLFVTGYCQFINQYCREHQIDKILFLSRDGDILKQAYDWMYPGENTEYVYWSRAAAVKLMAGHNKYDYFLRYIYHKTNKGFTIREVITSMELKPMLPKVIKEGFDPDNLLTDKNADKLKKFLLDNFKEIISLYQIQMKGAVSYFKEKLADCKKAAAIDIGWAGSGAVSLSYLTEKVWKFPCTVTGIIAGTNTVYNAEPDASESFLQNGKLVAYLYSQSHNRDLLKRHDLNKNYNVFWELLLSSPTPQFRGFYKGDVFPEDKSSRYVKAIDVTLKFGKCDENQEGIMEIQRGIMEFVREYYGHFKDLPYMLRISGRDAYAPMLVASGHKEKYLREIEKRFSLEIHI